MNFNFRKVVSVLLVVFMVASSVIPRKIRPVYADGIDIFDYNPITESISSKDYPSTTDPDFDISEIAVVSEEESKRTYDSKTFKKADGTYVLAAYNQVIHYEDNGLFKNINNSLTFDETNSEYENIANKFKIKLPKEIKENKKFKLTLDEYQIDWQILDINNSEIEVIDNDIKSNNIKELTNINQSVMYKNIQSNVDLEYILAGNKIKENIILNKYIENFSMTFEYSVKELKLVKGEDGSYAFVNGKNEVIFNFDDLYMIDNDYNTSGAVDISVVEIKEDVYQITITPDQSFLENAVYPVKVDPSISYSSSNSVLEHKYLISNEIYSYVGLNVGFSDWAETRSYINIDMDAISSNISSSEIYIDYAKLFIYVDIIYNSQGLNMIASEVTYPSQYDLITDISEVETSDVLDYNSLYNFVPNDAVVFDFSNKINEWFQTQTQYGVIELKKLNATIEGGAYFSTLYDDSYSPLLEIGYTEVEGIRDYWTYNTQDVGRVGTGYVSDYTGYLTFIRNDINFATELQNLSLAFAYNSLDQYTNTGYGDGWNISYNSKVGYDTISDNYYVEDFTGYKEHFIRPTQTDDLECELNSSEYVCYVSMDDGKTELRRMLNVFGNTSEYQLISHTEGITYHYSDTYYLMSIDQKSDNATSNVELTIQRNSNNLYYIDNIVDTSGNIISFMYDQTRGLLDSVQLTSATMTSSYLEKVNYSYDYMGKLIEVEHLLNYDLDNTIEDDYTIFYNYNNIVMRLNKGYILGGEKIEYLYDDSIGSYKKIANISSYFNDEQLSDLSYEYQSNETTISNHLIDSVKYTFDDFGHTIGVIDNDGNTVFYSYRNIYIVSDVNDIDYRNNHQVIYQSSPNVTKNNYIKNGSFEDNIDYWTESVYSNASTTQTEELVGVYSLWLDNADYIYQNVILDKGVYTLSSGIFNDTGSNEAFLQVNNYESERTESSSEWALLSMPLYIEEDNTTVQIKLFNNTTDEVYFDNVVLVEGLNNEKVNLVENSSFESNLDNWTVTEGSSSRIYVGSSVSENIGDYAVRLDGSVEEYRSISTIIDKNTIDAYENEGWLYLGGWVNAYTAPRTDKNHLYIYVSFFDEFDEEILPDDAEVPNRIIFFDQSKDSWQFNYNRIILPETYSYMKISFNYAGLGEVLFDGATVFYDASEMYYVITYEDFDNNEKRIDFIEWSDGRKIDYIYPDEDFADEPIGFIDEAGNSFEIEENNDVVDYIIFNNVKYDTTYNEYGQAESLQVSGSDGLGGFVDYFDTSTAYTSDNQYIDYQTDEFGNVTNYQIDVITGLLDYVENAKDVKTEYEYYDNGLLKKVSIDQGSVYDSYVIYVYNANNQLIEIKINHDSTSGYSYFIDYDDAGRMASVRINNQTMMSYTYNQEGDIETDEIASQTYGNGDKIYFEYTEDGQIEKISYQGFGEAITDKFSYLYDESGKLAVYNDLVNEYTEYYEYDASGNLTKITNSEEDVIRYEYDGSGNLSKVDYDISGTDSYINYYYQGELSNNLYNYTSYNNGGEVIKKEYDYEQNAIHRLDYISYTNSGSNLMLLEIDYEGDTTRLNEFTYSIVGTDSVEITYTYQYDSLGNITNEVYIKDSLDDSDDVHISKTYVYDDMNQLIQEHSRDYQYTVSSTYAKTNYTKYYHYDINGNMIAINTFGYGLSEEVDPIIPSFSLLNRGRYIAEMVYNGTQDYQDMYYLQVGQTPNINFTFYDHWDTTHQWPLNLTVTELITNLDTSNEGYYYNYYKATDGLNYDIRFRIVFKVGTPGPELREGGNYISYDYNSSWLDQLDSYTINNDISNITYDDSGNPINITNFKYEDALYNHAELEWEGRKLVNIKVYNSSDDTLLISEIWYTYNDQGLRIQKVIEDSAGIIKYDYKLSGDLVVLEVISEYNDLTQIYDELYKIAYAYDYDGTPIGFTYIDDLETRDYIYVKNLMGDITHITDLNGNIVVEYSYDAYGNITKVQGDDALTIGKYNSLRYRSYIYDEETAFYYLQSRYYNPEIGRFINADGLLGEVGNIQTHNMYAYCANNPVMYTDISGYTPEWLNAIGNWFEEHWIEIAIGTAFIVAGVLTMGIAAYIGGATFAGVMSAMCSAISVSLIHVGISMGISAVIGGLISADTGGDFWSGFTDGLASGYMWGGIFAGTAQMVSGAMSITRSLAPQFNGFKIGSVKIWSPNGATNPNIGGTIIKFGRWNRFDAEYSRMIHVAWTVFGHNLNHIPIGTVLAGILGGVS